MRRERTTEGWRPLGVSGNEIALETEVKSHHFQSSLAMLSVYYL